MRLARERRRRLLALPIERVLVSHGQPVLHAGRAALEAAIERAVPGYPSPMAPERYRTVDIAAVASAPGPHPAASAYDKSVGQALGVRAFGIYQVELPPGAETVRHDHLDDGAEDVYAILRGTGVVVVDGEAVRVQPGAFVAVVPDATRQVRAGADGLVFIAVCAPP